MSFNVIIVKCGEQILWIFEIVMFQLPNSTIQILKYFRCSKTAKYLHICKSWSSLDTVKQQHSFTYLLTAVFKSWSISDSVKQQNTKYLQLSFWFVLFKVHTETKCMLYSRWLVYFICWVWANQSQPIGNWSNDFERLYRFTL